MIARGSWSTRGVSAGFTPTLYQVSGGGMNIFNRLLTQWALTGYMPVIRTRVDAAGVYEMELTGGESAVRSIGGGR